MSYENLQTEHASEVKESMEAFINELFIDEIVQDQALQSREGIDKGLVKEYADIISEHGYIFSIPIEVYFERASKTYWLVDGFHRVTAAQQCGIKKIRAKCIYGSYQDAQYACTLSNIKNGRQRTKKDHEKAVRMMLLHPYGKGVTNSVVAKRLLVTNHTVKKVREELEHAGLLEPLEKNEGLDGKRYASTKERKEPSPTLSRQASSAEQIETISLGPIVAPTPSNTMPSHDTLPTIAQCYHVPDCECHKDCISSFGEPISVDSLDLDDIFK